MGRQGGKMHDDGSSRNKGKGSVDQMALHKWKAPPPGWTKVNVDGSFVAETGTAGVGVVARDTSGQVIFSAWRTLLRCADAPEAEARACAEGFRLAAEWSPGPAIIESDCSRVVKAIQKGDDRSKIGFVVTEAREITRLLVDWQIALVKRECNGVANELARRTAHTAVWLGHAPACLEELISSDCNSSS